MSNFQAHTLEQHEQAISQYMPNDRLFQAKNVKGTNLYKLFLGLGGEFTRVDEIFQNVWDNTNILTTNDLEYIARWESAVGIPDSIFSDTDSLTLDERKNNILLKLRSLNCLTEQDFIDLAALLGQVITIKHGTEIAFPAYTLPFVPIRNSKTAKFIWIIQGEDLDVASYPAYSVPFTPSAPASQLRNLFEVLKPAMTTLIYQNS